MPLGAPPRLLMWDCKTGREVAHVELAVGDGVRRVILTVSGTIILGMYTAARSGRTLAWTPGSQPALRELFTGGAALCFVQSRKIGIVEPGGMLTACLSVPLDFDAQKPARAGGAIE